MSALKKYKIERAGAVYHVLTTDEDAKRRGLEAVEVPVEKPAPKAPAVKAARPSNKAAKPADK